MTKGRNFGENTHKKKSLPQAWIDEFFRPQKSETFFGLEARVSTIAIGVASKGGIVILSKWSFQNLNQFEKKKNQQPFVPFRMLDIANRRKAKNCIVVDVYK